MPDRTEKIKEYISGIEGAVNGKNAVPTNRPDFYLVVPCANSGKNITFNETPTIEVKFKTIPNHSANPKEVCPYEQPLSGGGYNNYLEFIENNQAHPDLVHAYELYDNGKGKGYVSVYNKLAQNFFILSSLWGIIKADKKIPHYNITLEVSSYGKGCSNVQYINKQGVAFNANNNLCFNDLEKIAKENPQKPIVFFGSDNYIQRFIELSKNFSNDIILVHKRDLSKIVIPSWWKKIHINCDRRTAWYYDFMKKI